jgi:predicted phosphodiesterase
VSSLRIVAVADTHLYHRDLTVPDGDVLVHCGDLCQAGTLTVIDLSAERVSAVTVPPARRT